MTTPKCSLCDSYHDDRKLCSTGGVINVQRKEIVRLQKEVKRLDKEFDRMLGLVQHSLNGFNRIQAILKEKKDMILSSKENL